MFVQLLQIFMLAKTPVIIYGSILTKGAKASFYFLLQLGLLGGELVTNPLTKIEKGVAVLVLQLSLIFLYFHPLSLKSFMFA